MLIDRARPKPGERVLDVGCGSGATTFAFAKAVAPNGFALGLDVSEPMLSQARAFAPKGLPLDFALADATVHPFEPASFDLLASRFGVMFFADPVASFTNLQQGAEAVGTAGLRLLARAEGEPVDDGAADGGLQARAENAPGRAGGAGPISLCFQKSA